MFVRKKKYPSGNIGVIVVEKIGRKMKELATIGVAYNEDEVENLVNEAKEWISKEESRRHPQLDLYDEERDACEWDGLKGYLTNTDIPIQDVYTAYHNLWHVERAFRIAKSKIEIRPMFHFTRKRIEAHICICFVALKVNKELERMLKVSEIKMNVDKVLALAKTITTIQIKLPLNKEVYPQTMLMARHQKIAKLFDENFWVTQ
ncbi:transposase [uncultured Prevotella sp.]|uniref:IS1634 family transposase n=1 Tax=uncultured Prevotella sp. TaxID=159272 RepID=UPI0027E38CB8|nr:transposase [uncultured Prevotella sp.]